MLVLEAWHLSSSRLPVVVLQSDSPVVIRVAPTSRAIAKAETAISWQGRASSMEWLVSGSHETPVSWS